MVQTALVANSVLWASGGVYFFYAFGVSVITWHWSVFGIALLIMIILTVSEIALSTQI